MENSRIALIEIGGSHDECLLTQMKALQRRGQNILLITSQAIWDRNPTFQDYVDEVFIVEVQQSKSDIKKVWTKLKSSGVQKAVINTAQGNAVRSLCLKALFHSIEFIGIIHTSRMFTESFTQKIISRKIKKYLLLSEFLLKSVQAPRGISLDYFYPISFPSIPLIVEKQSKVVCIVGGVESRRKDLKGFFQIVEAAPENMRFVFLGKSDPNKEEVTQFLSTLEAKRLTDRVKTFESFVPQKEFDQWVQQADFILPLVHPETPSADQYFRNQIPGAMTVAMGYKKPLLIHEAYKNWGELKPAALYYNFETIGDQLKASGETLDAIREQMAKAFNEAEQQERFAGFVLD